MVDFGFNWISFSTSEFAWLCLHPQVSDHIARRRPITRWYRWNPAITPPELNTVVLDTMV